MRTGAPPWHLLPAALAVAAALALAVPALAEEARIAFRVAPGPAQASIPEFARQSGLTILANGDDLAGRATRELQGSYTSSQGLALLLEGSGLTAQKNARGNVLIQPAPAPPPPPTSPAHAAGTPVQQVRVAGTRASQQDSIGLKKNAPTLLDAIVAEDVGAFPDRNVAEAISRLAGVTLDRGEYGEGTTINVRGNAPSVTRVEIDGLGVQSGGGTDLNNGGSGRGVELRELSADLIKSIEVIKGATADMTEGSLGGTVIIHTRTGLDFRQRYVALRAAAQENSINGKRTPNLNFIFADRLLDGRLGVLVNLGNSAARNENHTITMSPVANGTARLIDFDGSPEKTFAYNPSTVSKTDPAATAPLASWPTTTGGRFDALSPLEIVTRAASTQTKADCYAAFPLYTSADVAAISTSTGRAAARSQRANELKSCLNQWSDYTPQNLRYQMRRQFDRRLNADLRLDFKVDDRLALYVKIERNRRAVLDEQLFHSLGGISINPDGSYVDSGSAPNLVRTPVAGSGYYLYPTPSNPGTSGSTWRGLTNGSTVNIDPASVVVDANHHVVRYTLNNASVNNDQLYDQIATRSGYTQAGGTWRAGGLRVDVLAGRTRARETRMQWRTNFGFNIGQTTVSATPDGLWLMAPAAGTSFDEHDVGNYGKVAAQASANLPLVSSATQLTLANPRLLERGEDTLRLALAWTPSPDLPWLRRIRWGGERRDYDVASWTGAGYTVQAASGTAAAIVVPKVAIGSSFQACEDTPASLAPTGTPCRYGTANSTSASNAFASSIVLNQATYRNVVAQALGGDTIGYFNSLPNRPAGLPDRWTEIDVPKVIALTGVRNFNLDCVQFCTGSDGKRYEQPKSGVAERTLAAWLSTDFEVDRLPFGVGTLPFGWTLDGNAGWRVVRTSVAATGLMTFQTIAKTAAYDTGNPAAAAGIATTAVSRNTSLRDASLDVMPVLNLAWWPVPERMVVRYSRAKAIARPPVEYLYSSGVTCTYDERKLAASTTPDAGGLGDMSCDDTLGNPGLRASTNHNYNLSFEWYPNRDTMLALTRFRQVSLVGTPIRVAVTGGMPFAQSGTADPGTGRDLATVPYTYATWMNGPGGERDGFELAAKTAFTFLPSFLPSVLRRTGLDLNYTHATSTSQQGAVRELVSGDVLAPANELAYTWNASLWYDDGKLRARVAMQGASSFFRGLTTLTTDYPANGITSTPAVAFNPAQPTFRDARRFIDAKVSYRLDNGIELFAEGRNLGRKAVTNSQGQYAPFASGASTLLDYAYSGAQYMVGVTYRH